MAKAMRKSFSISLDEDFADRLERAMESEFVIALRKNQLDLSDSTRLHIFKHARKQIETKISVMGKKKDIWSVGDRELVLRISSKEDNDLRSPGNDDETILIKRNTSDWVVADENDRVDDTLKYPLVPINDFKDYVQDEMIEWARSAVFYGVNSYTN